MIKEKTKQWVELAEEDYENIKYCWEGKRYRLTVFCAQQCVEKILKAYIIENRNIPPPKIHDIDDLIQRTNLDITEIDSPECIDLSQAYIRVRYEDFDKTYAQKRNNCLHSRLPIHP
jgi:HEPN domain-containing protein